MQPWLVLCMKGTLHMELINLFSAWTLLHESNPSYYLLSTCLSSYSWRCWTDKPRTELTKRADQAAVIALIKQHTNYPTDKAPTKQCNLQCVILYRYIYIWLVLYLYMIRAQFMITMLESINCNQQIVSLIPKLMIITKLWSAVNKQSGNNLSSSPTK